jgi:hypothetical protein
MSSTGNVATQTQVASLGSISFRGTDNGRELSGEIDRSWLYAEIVKNPALLCGLIDNAIPTCIHRKGDVKVEGLFDGTATKEEIRDWLCDQTGSTGTKISVDKVKDGDAADGVLATLHGMQKKQPTKKLPELVAILNAACEWELPVSLDRDTHMRAHAVHRANIRASENRIKADRAARLKALINGAVDEIAG